MSLAHISYADVGVKARGLGGAYRALALSNDIIFYNPAALLKHRLLGIDAFYHIMFHKDEHIWGLSLIDAKTSALALGLAYKAHINYDYKHNTAHDMKAALSFYLVPKLLSLGTSLDYTYASRAEQEHNFNMDIAILFESPLALALVIDHILKSKGLEKPMSMALALALEMDKISNIPLALALDWQMGDIKSDHDLQHSIALGGEYLLLPIMPLRLGFNAKPKAKDYFLSLGAGFMAYNARLDGVYEQHLLAGKNRSLGLSLALFW